METRFEITVSYGQDGDAVKTDKLTGVRIVGDENGGSEGTDALEVPVELKVMRIDLDGKNAIKKPLGGGNQGVAALHGVVSPVVFFQPASRTFCSVRTA